jgi:hypothetical protein
VVNLPKWASTPGSSKQPKVKLAESTLVVKQLCIWLLGTVWFFRHLVEEDGARLQRGPRSTGLLMGINLNGKLGEVWQRSRWQRPLSELDT